MEEAELKTAAAISLRICLVEAQSKVLKEGRVDARRSLTKIFLQKEEGERIKITGRGNFIEMEKSKIRGGKEEEEKKKRKREREQGRVLG